MLNLIYVEDDLGSRNVVKMIERMFPDDIKITIWEDSTHFSEKLLAITSMPDMILLDIHVNPLNGFEMLQIVRNYAQFNEIPVVALTASVMNEEVDLLKRSGFQGVISKPLDIDAFPLLIHRIIQGEKIWYIW